MDYGKYKYEAAQKAKESRRKASNVSIKEMKYRPRISRGDFDTKTRKVERFLEDGHKVKVTVTFRPPELRHPELGRRILDDVVAAVEHVAKVEIFPRQDGRNMTVVLGPDRKAQAANERARRQASGQSRSAPAAPVTPTDGAGSPSDGEASSDGEAPADGSAGGAEPAPVTAAGPADTVEPTTQNQPSDG
jgi:translation initiation factor IF-3